MNANVLAGTLVNFAKLKFRIARLQNLALVKMAEDVLTITLITLASANWVLPEKTAQLTSTIV